MLLLLTLGLKLLRLYSHSIVLIRTTRMNQNATRHVVGLTSTTRFSVIHFDFQNPDQSREVCQIRNIKTPLLSVPTHPLHLFPKTTTQRNLCPESYYRFRLPISTSSASLLPSPVSKYHLPTVYFTISPPPHFFGIFNCCINSRRFLPCFYISHISLAVFQEPTLLLSFLP